MRHLQTLRLIEAVARAGSIRRAAEDMAITSSALNRRITGFEDEFGFPIFERLPRGVRLNPAGELLIQHIRSQISDLARVQSQVADLSGVRRGHVSIACSQAMLPYFLPAQIAAYRRAHPGVTFSVHVRDRAAAESDLSAFRSDLALVFEPVYMVEFEVLMSVQQPVFAVMAEGHPLASLPELRLRDCLAGPHVVPASPYGVRHLLEMSVRGRSLRISPIIEAESFDFMRHYVLHEGAVAFQIPVGLKMEPGSGVVAREVSVRDVPPGHLLLGQMKGRSLPVAPARFAHQVSAAFAAMGEAQAAGLSGTGAGRG